MTNASATNIVARAIYWLQDRPVLNVILVLAYGISILFLHDVFVNLSIVVMTALTLPIYNMVVAVVALLVCLGLLVFIYKRYTSDSAAVKMPLLAMGLYGLLLVSHALTMLEMNIEIIHAAQFGILTFFIYPLVGRFGGALVFTLPFMLLDEWVQYRILYPEYVMYFELNDIVLDLLGSSVMLCLMWLSLPRNVTYLPPIFKRPETTILFVLLVGFRLLSKACIIAFYPFQTCENTLFVMNKLDEPFILWQTHPFTQRMYHVLTPMEGVGLIALLCVLGFVWDRVEQKKLNK